MSQVHTSQINNFAGNDTGGAIPQGRVTGAAPGPAPAEVEPLGPAVAAASEFFLLFISILSVFISLYLLKVATQEYKISIREADLDIDHTSGNYASGWILLASIAGWIIYKRAFVMSFLPWPMSEEPRYVVAAIIEDFWKNPISYAPPFFISTIFSSVVAITKFSLNYGRSKKGAGAVFGILFAAFNLSASAATLLSMWIQFPLFE